MDRRERFEQAVRDREQKKRDVEQRWSRREEVEFYKVSQLVDLFPIVVY